MSETGAWVPLTQISELIGYKIHPATAHRWRQTGVVHDGRRIKLPVRKIGSRFFVNEESVRAFLERLNSEPEQAVLTGSLIDKAESGQLLDKFGV